MGQSQRSSAAQQVDRAIISCSLMGGKFGAAIVSNNKELFPTNKQPAAALWTLVTYMAPICQHASLAYRVRCASHLASGTTVDVVKDWTMIQHRPKIPQGYSTVAFAPHRQTTVSVLPDSSFSEMSNNIEIVECGNVSLQ